LPTSPLLGQGTLTPAGGLFTIDLEGHPRTFNNTIDMGAYERGDEIYSSDFDLGSRRNPCLNWYTPVHASRIALSDTRPGI
jgi:hypothetical protein